MQFGNKALDETTPLTKSGYAPSAVLLGRLVACASALAEGFDGGSFGAIVVDVRDEFGMSSHAVGLLSGVPCFCLAITAALGGVLANNMGRKQAMGVVYSLLATGMFIMASSSGLYGFAMGRCIVCSAIGAGMTVVSTYLAEITPARSRGFLVSLEDVFLQAGMMMAYALGIALVGQPGGWRSITYLGAVIPLCALTLLMFPQVPESPRYLHMTGRNVKAQQVLRQLLSDPTELKETLAAWENPQQIPWFQAIRQTRARVFMVSIGVCCSATLCGVPAINGMLSLLLSNSLPKQQVGTWAFAIMLAKLIPLFPTSFFLVEQVGRRKLLITSAITMALGACITAVALTADLPGSLVAVGLMVHISGFSLGMGPAVWPYMSEVLPTDVRSPGVGVAVFLSRMVEGTQRFALPMALEVAEWMVFAACSVSCCLIAAFVYRFCPETQGKRLEDIPALFTD